MGQIPSKTLQLVDQVIRVIRENPASRGTETSLKEVEDYTGLPTQDPTCGGSIGSMR